jgi:DNA-binding transcriptional ArsR family regulator
MEESSVIEALSALAHDSRLAIYRLLMQEGANGLPAGQVGQRLGIPANALSFHLTRLRYAGLVTSRRNGRQIIYAADYEGMQKLMGFLTENCCHNAPEGCSPDCPPTKSSQIDDKQRHQVTESVRQPVSQS